MALQKNIVSPQGLLCNAVYLVITDINYSKDNNVNGMLLGFKNSSARVEGFSPIVQFNFAFTFDLSSNLDIIAQAYLAIKQLPEFSDAVDV